MPPKGSRSKARSKVAEAETVEPVSANNSVSNMQDGEEASATKAPATRRSKRKAAQEEAAAYDDDAAAKKPKVSVHTTEVGILSSNGKPAQHQTHRSMHIEIPIKQTGKRIVFDNNDNDDNDDELASPDGPNEFFTPQGSPTTATPTSAQQQPKQDENEDEDEDGSDSDDDAPEAVSTHTAAAQAAKSAQAAAHAAGRQREVERQKRQERDARLKAQAKGSRKKQQQDEEEDDEKKKEAESESEEDGEKKKAPAIKATTKRFTKNNLPDLLPEDFLASDSESDEDQDEHRHQRQNPTIIKFNTVARQVAKAESRQPADQRVGSTVYRVMKKKGDQKLAPKGGKFSRNAREGLLGRGRAGTNNNKSKTTAATTMAKKGGFLVKR